MSDALADLVLRHASLCGPFDPFGLVDWLELKDEDGKRRDAALRALAAHSAERIAGGPYRWMLEPDSRREALEALVSKKVVASALNAAPALEPGDGFGAALRAALSPKAKVEDPARADGEADEAYLNRLLRFWGDVFDAAQFAEIAPGCDDREVGALRRRAAQRIRALRNECDIHTVLPKTRSVGEDGEVVERQIPLIGRDHYRNRLSRHLRGVEDDDRPMLLTGIGGAGKSALLASVIRPWRERRTAPITIILDFDRRQLVTGEPVQVMHEFLRQLSTGLAAKAQIPPTRLAATQAFIGELRDDLPGRASTGDVRSFDSQFAFILSAVLPRLQEDAAAPLRDARIALVIDSFETVDRQDGVYWGGDDHEVEAEREEAPVVRMMMKLEAEVRAHGLGGLRTVVSGRAEPLSQGHLARFFGDGSHRIHLEGVGKVSGGRLLEAFDTADAFTDRALREAASEALNGHPLSLQMLARFAATRKKDAVKLIRDVIDDPEFKAKLTQSVLYDRILERISDPDVRKLAHPGLALRQINADMIRLVLAEPCFGAPLDDARARGLLQSLQTEYWMVEAGRGDFPVRHRPDVRRLMTPGLFAGPSDNDSAVDKQRKTELAEKARAVCRAAAALFENGPPENNDPAERWWRDMPEADREVEALYYRALAAEEAPDLNQDLANRMHMILREDLTTLPAAWTARVKAWRDEPMTDKELQTLPPHLRERAEQAAFERATRHGDAMRAARGPRRGAAPPPDGAAPRTPRRAPQTAEQMDREIYRLFTTAEFDAVAEIGPRFLEMARDTESHPLYGDDVWHTPSWQCLLVAGADPSEAWRIESSDQSGEMRPIDHVIRILNSIVGQNPVETTHLLHDLIGAFFDWVAPEQMPVAANRRAGADLMVTLFGQHFQSTAARKDPRPAQEFILSPRAFSLGAWSIPTVHPLPKLPRLPGALSFIIEPIYRSGPPKLGDFQKAYRSGELIRFSDKDVRDLEPEARAVFGAMARGLSPELYEPATVILRNLPDVTVVSFTAELNNSSTMNWPRDLLFEHVKHYDPAQAATIVETADQCGILGDLLDLAAEQDPRAAKLARMHQKIGAWFFPRPELS